MRAKTETTEQQISVNSEIWNAYTESLSRSNKQPQNALFNDYAQKKVGITEDNLTLINNKSNLKKPLYERIDEDIRKAINL